jgi:glutamate 5-kinase
MDRRDLARARRLVVKIGSGVLAPGGRFDPVHLHALAAELAAIASERSLVIVSSGAIALGVQRLGWTRRPRDMPRKQAAAAVGQAALVAAWDEALGRRVTAAQVLLTHDVLSDRKRFLHARSTFAALLAERVVPVVNENDTVAVDEIRFGDNDALAALVAQVIDADLLVILSDVDAVYDADPRRVRTATPLRTVRRVDAALVAPAGGAGTTVGTGGMATKIEAARRCQRLGVPCVIGPGRDPATVRRALAGDEVGTFFVPQERLRGRRRWIAQAARTRGVLLVDEGARAAVTERKRSLLASGVREVRGEFGVGDVVELADLQGRPFGRGLARYPATDLRRIAGTSSAEIERVLGYSDGAEVVHRDDLALEGS